MGSLGSYTRTGFFAFPPDSAVDDDEPFLLVTSPRARRPVDADRLRVDRRGAASTSLICYRTQAGFREPGLQASMSYHQDSEFQLGAC